tara:strand:- start:162 stop:335 length:174 start_codon:yes stop_codon:yes gene_type:complete
MIGVIMKEKEIIKFIIDWLNNNINNLEKNLDNYSLIEDNKLLLTSILNLKKESDNEN